ncbi:hypothetical protein L6R52_17040 [Myxococcota bacterium]|nr:hypothetical protein [Myxococcota bacterium]
MNPTLTDFDDDRDTVIITASDERTFSRIEPLPRPPIPAAPRRAIASPPREVRVTQAMTDRRERAAPRHVSLLAPPDAWDSSLEAELERALERQFPLPSKARRAARPEPARRARRPRALEVFAALSLVVAGIVLSIVAQRIAGADVVAAVLDHPAPSQPTNAEPRSVEPGPSR